MKTIVSTKGQMILPAEIGQQGRIQPSRQRSPNEGLVDWLMACPKKGYFVPIASKSTDTL